MGQTRQQQKQERAGAGAVKTVVYADDEGQSNADEHRFAGREISPPPPATASTNPPKNTRGQTMANWIQVTVIYAPSPLTSIVFFTVIIEGGPHYIRICTENQGVKGIMILSYRGVTPKIGDTLSGKISLSLRRRSAGYGFHPGIWRKKMSECAVFRHLFFDIGEVTRYNLGEH